MRTKLTTYFLSSFILLLFLAVEFFAQVPLANKSNAKVAGRIIVDGQPRFGVQILLKKREAIDLDSDSPQSPADSATTDADGRYEITNLAPGVYLVSVYSPAYVIEGDSRLSEPGKIVDVKGGEQIENLDFSLKRGGVITGKVTDEYGKPVIAEGVGAFRLDREGKRDKAAAGDMLKWQTDDRGEYRIFGLESGRYIVGVGASSEDVLQPTGSRGSYKRTYHPDAVDESSAKVVEVSPGAEATNVDIKLAPSTKRFTVSGRVIDSESGKPLPGVMIRCELAKTAGSSFRTGDTTTNSNGEFRIERLSPNTYTVYVFNPGQNEFYSDPVNFDVADADVNGLEIKIIRGATITGVAEVEGTRDPTVLARMSQIQLRAEATSQDLATLMMMLMQGGGVGSINPNGAFRISGVRSGRTRIVALPPPNLKGFTLARAERNSVELREFDVAQGEQITGLRLVFTYGTSVLAGHVEIKGGELPLNAQMTVRIVREGASAEEWWFAKQANVDARGQFSIEGISQGNYKVYLMIIGDDPQTNFPRVEQSISIPDDTTREITLVLDLTKKGDL